MGWGYWVFEFHLVIGRGSGVNNVLLMDAFINLKELSRPWLPQVAVGYITFNIRWRYPGPLKETHSVRITASLWGVSRTLLVSKTVGVTVLVIAHLTLLIGLWNSKVQCISTPALSSEFKPEIGVVSLSAFQTTIDRWIIIAHHDVAIIEHPSFFFSMIFIAPQWNPMILSLTWKFYIAVVLNLGCKNKLSCNK